jgi:hypothetical protein
MTALATVGALIEVTPWDELQHWPDAGAGWKFIDDPTSFRFRVAGELVDDGFFFGLQGPVESGPERYLNLICNIMLRHDNSDWRNTSECGAAFRVCPSIAKRDPSYDPSAHDNLPFYFYPEGTIVEGYPRVSRFGGVRVVEEPENEIPSLRAPRPMTC